MDPSTCATGHWMDTKGTWTPLRANMSWYAMRDMMDEKIPTK